MRVKQSDWVGADIHYIIIIIGIRNNKFIITFIIVFLNIWQKDGISGKCVAQGSEGMERYSVAIRELCISYVICNCFSRMPIEYCQYYQFCHCCLYRLAMVCCNANMTWRYIISSGVTDANEYMHSYVVVITLMSSQERLRFHYAIALHSTGSDWHRLDLAQA